jgi:hypothetical protein
LIKYANVPSEDYYWYKMDLTSTQAAIAVSGMPQEVSEWIWEVKHELGEVIWH